MGSRNVTLFGMALIFVGEKRGKLFRLKENVLNVLNVLFNHKK